MTHRFERVRLPSFALATLTLLLCLSAFTAARASAHAATSAHEIRMIINGRAYTTTVGHKLTFPITYSDGSKGTVSYMANVINVKTTGDPCTTAGAYQTFSNAFGGTLAQYTLWQYWCYNTNINITRANPPYETDSEGYGWTLADHNEYGNGFNSYDGSSVGTFRFNGPFGIGCKSGLNEIVYFNDGSFSPYFNQDSYYGC